MLQVVQVVQVAQAVHDDENQDGEGELSDDAIDRLLESANEELDYLKERRAERTRHLKQQNSHYVRTEQASRKLFPIAKQVG